MCSIDSIIYRYLTDADFFNINKPRGSEELGGGQSYIDFPTVDIVIAQWRDFFIGVTNSFETAQAVGPAWSFPIYSIGLPMNINQPLKIYQRRGASVSIAAQKIHSVRSNRVWSWHPTYGFPVPKDANDRHQLPTGLAIYIARTDEGEVWAGWFVRNDNKLLPSTDKIVLGYLSNMFSTKRKEGDAGILYCGPNLLILDNKNPRQAFTRGTDLDSKDKASTGKAAKIVSITNKSKSVTKKKTIKKKPAKKKTYKQRTKTEDEIIDSLFAEDSDYTDSEDETVIKTITTTRKRNQRAVSALKKLYKHKCQISDTQYLFKKRDGIYYTEAHHLVPLGEGGADNPLNMIIVSPLIHRMLHYADVEEFDLSKVKVKPDGSASLRIMINGEKFSITWKRRHFEMIMRFMEGNS